MEAEIELAARLMAEGERARESSDYAAARHCFEQALAIRQQVLGEAHPETAASHSNLGNITGDMGDYAAARTHHERALAIRRQSLGESHPDVATSLNNLGIVFAEQGDFGTARDFFERALAIRRKALGDAHPDTAASHTSLGNVTSDLGDYATARSHHERALAIQRQALDETDVAMSLGNIGAVLGELGDYSDAAEHFERALEIEQRAFGESHPFTAQTFHNLATVMWRLGDYAAARTYNEKALAVRQQIFGETHPSVASTLYTLGVVLVDLGDHIGARGNFETALAICREVLGDTHPGVARILTALGAVLSALGEHAAARAHHEQALAIERQVLGETHPDAARSIHNIGSTWESLGDLGAARAHYEQALALLEQVLGETNASVCSSVLALAALNRVERLYDRAGEYAERALRIALMPDNVVHLPQAYHELSLLKGAQGATDAAIFFGKQAVNALQRQRARLTGLAMELQRSFVGSKESLYRDLSDRLVEAGRLGEAQQVLAMLKEEELFDLLRRDAGSDPRLTLAQLTGLEAQWQRHGDALGQDLARLTEEVAGLRKIANRTPEQEASLKATRTALDAAGREFRAWLDGLRVELVGGGAAGSAESRHSAALNLDLLERLQGDLRELGPGVALVSYVLGERRLSIILTTASFQVSREVEIAERSINRLVHEFRLAIDQRLDADLARTGQALWRHLIAPVLGSLEEIGAHTLMIVPYGTLRYLPFAALHDGDRYLVERFAVSILTLAAHSDLRHRGEASWQVAGFGVSREVPGYRRLVSVGEELSGIVRTEAGGLGIYPGTIRLDEAFTEGSFADGLDGHEAVHVASHFVLNPAQGLASHLLLGDGTSLSLERLRDVSFDFHGLELMTLSACETAMGGGGENGREFEGFAALVQQRGVKAVIASLWAVADESTAPLMTAFYRARQEGLSKAAALQAAQIALLGGGRHAHPYHWAPFTLLGNWR